MVANGMPAGNHVDPKAVIGQKYQYSKYFE